MILGTIDPSLLAGALDAVPSAVLALDADLRWVACNAAAERALGVPAAALLGQPLGALPLGSGTAALDAACRAARRGAAPVVVDAPGLAVAPVAGADGGVAGVVVTLAPPEPPPAASARGDVLDTLPAAVIAYDTDLCVTAWNASAARSSTIPRERALGRSLLELFPYIRGTDIEAEYRRSLRGEVVDGRDRCWTPTGEEQPRWFDVVYLPVRDRDGTVTGGVVTTTDVTSRREAHEALTQERRLLRTLVDAAPLEIVAFDARHRVTEWNAQAERATGMRRADVVGRRLPELLADCPSLPGPDDYGPALAGERVNVASRWLSASAAPERCVDLLVSPTYDGRGAITGAMALVVDCTARARAEREAGAAQAALGAERALLRAIIDTAPSAIMAFDRELRYTEWNRACERNTGTPRAAALGQRLDALVPPDFDAERGARRWTRVLAGETLEHEEDAIVLPGLAGLRHLHSTLAPLRAPDGAVVGGVIVSHDVTAHVHAERALRDERAFLRSLIDTAPASIVAFDRDLRQTEWNFRAERNTGIRREDAIGRTTEALFPGFLGTPWHAQVLRVLAGEVLMGLDFALVEPATGQPLVLDVTMAPLYDAAGAVVGALVMSLDVTDREQARQALKESEARYRQLFEEGAAARAAAERASQAKSLFLAGLSHELRTPLGAVIGFAQLLRDGRDGTLTAEQREYLDDVLAGGEHLRRVVDDALDLARIEAGVIDLRPSAVDLRALVAETLATVGRLARERGVRLHHAVAAEAATIVADPARVRQVLLNYLTNAIKFNRPGGDVAIEVRADPEGVRLTVRDSGRGIAPQDQPRLFVEFQRLGVQDVAGSGLGLAITRRIVEAMGGSVAVESAPGAGSAFHAVLPWAQRLPDGADPGGPATAVGTRRENAP